eukprot:m.223046 g.223046  ORF g.223046 m.223046 type:complete len:104 (+) comp19194_c0_seq3:1102-1413(+)
MTLPSTRAESSTEKMFRPEGSGDSDLYFSMIVPVLRMRFKAIFWLQGESDVNPSDTQMQPQRGGAYYACQIKAMVSDWRIQFNVCVTLPTSTRAVLSFHGVGS